MDCVNQQRAVYVRWSPIQVHVEVQAAAAPCGATLQGIPGRHAALLQAWWAHTHTHLMVRRHHYHHDHHN